MQRKYAARHLTATERFKRNFVQGRPDECWLWKGTRTSKGYGRFRPGPVGPDGRQTPYVRAHRFSYEHYVGPISAGKIVRHSCDTPLCVNPRHLLEGTNTDNMRDAVARGRIARGERSGNAKLTEKKVRLAVVYRLLGKTKAEIARTLGVKDTAIDNVLSGKTWRHVAHTPEGLNTLTEVA